MKFCSNSVMLNETPNDNDVTHIANIVLNEAPNSNDATCIANNLYLNTIGALNGSYMQSCRKPIYQR